MINKIFTLILFILLFPLLTVIGLFIFIRTGQNPVFVQERGLTLSMFRFRIYKFRTLLKNPSGYAPNNTLKNTEEERFVFPFGRFLRRTGLDELPQLINIIKGELRFVGPRPLDLRDLSAIKNLFGKYYVEREKLNLLPGVTGYWQVYKDEERSVQNLIELDKHYSKIKSINVDAKIIYKSIVILFRAKHKDSIVNPKSYLAANGLKRPGKKISKFIVLKNYLAWD